VRGRRVHEGCDLGSDNVADIVVPDVDMLTFTWDSRRSSEFDCSLVVFKDLEWTSLRKAHGVKKTTQVEGSLDARGKSDVLRFHAALSNAVGLFGRMGIYGAVVVAHSDEVAVMTAAIRVDSVGCVAPEFDLVVGTGEADVLRRMVKDIG